jgi:hypothetical protein
MVADAHALSPFQQKLTEQLQDLFKRRGLAGNSELQQEITHVAFAYLEMLQVKEQTQEVDKKNRAIVPTSPAEQQSKQKQGRLLKEQLARIEAHLADWNQQALAGFMQRPDAMDAYRPYLISLLEPDVVQYKASQLLSDDIEKCRHETAHRLLGSAIRCVRAALPANVPYEINSSDRYKYLEYTQRELLTSARRKGGGKKNNIAEKP